MLDQYRLKFSMKNLLSVFSVLFLLTISVSAQNTDSAVIVQPGLPGQETKVLPSDTNATLPPMSEKDVEFMQGMIHHHRQAIEMVALMKDRTDNEDLRRLGSRISHTQSEEMKFMERWLETRRQKISMDMPMSDKMNMSDMNMSAHKDHKMETDKMNMSAHKNHIMLMPGMLTPEQMKQLAEANGPEFDRLFLTGMIQHHEGALVMVDELFKTAGAGQDPEMFTFATDVDSSQRAEIRIMKTMLVGKP